MKKDFFEKEYGKLIGKTVSKIVKDEQYGEISYGIVFQDNTVAWILCDPEGNGPGHLDICDGLEVE